MSRFESEYNTCACLLAILPELFVIDELRAMTEEMKALLQDWANRMAKPVEWQSDGEKGILFPNDGGKDFRNPDNSTEFKDEFPDRAWMMKKWMKEYRAEPPAGSTSGPEEYGEIPADIASKYDE